MKILFVKKPSLLREGIVQLLNRRFQESVIRVSDGSSYSDDLITNELSDMIILDLEIDLSHKEIIEIYKQANKKVIIWVADKECKKLNELFTKNLDGYFYNGMEERELIEAIELVQKDKKYVHPALSRLLLADYVRIQTKVPSQPIGLLSNREWEVLQLLSKGYNNIDIATHLYLSDKTVKNYVSSILRKLEVPDRTNAVLKALKQKWIYV
ncbi:MULTISPECIES: response regulator transcription factor [Paraliobacillus]|uniref:response regulator transcription factor n=1 Tax=Paraliobacillus TaxID=200903 RepID=UPI000DD46D37|nr:MULTISPECIES: response regulator transcription factor [Paraliobacillus]